MSLYEELANKVPKEIQDFVLVAMNSIKEADGVLASEQRDSLRGIEKSVRNIELTEVKIEENQSGHNKADDIRFAEISEIIKLSEARAIESRKQFREDMLAYFAGFKIEIRQVTEQAVDTSVNGKIKRLHEDVIANEKLRIETEKVRDVQWKRIEPVIVKHEKEKIFEEVLETNTEKKQKKWDSWKNLGSSIVLVSVVLGILFSFILTIVKVVNYFNK